MTSEVIQMAMGTYCIRYHRMAQPGWLFPLAVVGLPTV